MTPAAAPTAESLSSSAALLKARTIAADLPLLPEGVAYAVRPPEVVKAVFEFAARHPEVLKYIPCICGCERMGHQGNDMCFVSRRDESGKVREWEPHGLICEHCLDIGRDSMQMFNSGASIEDIRRAIEKKYVLTAATHTPTPMPPHRGGLH